MPLLHDRPPATGGPPTPPTRLSCGQSLLCVPAHQHGCPHRSDSCYESQLGIKGATDSQTHIISWILQKERDYCLQEKDWGSGRDGSGVPGWAPAWREAGLVQTLTPGLCLQRQDPSLPCPGPLLSSPSCSRPWCPKQCSYTSLQSGARPSQETLSFSQGRS